MTIVRLGDATDATMFGGKAAALSAALRAELPVPEGFALTWQTTESVARGDDSELQNLPADQMYAVRSSAVGEDSAAACFAGAHVSVLGVTGTAELARAITTVYESRNAAGASAYRRTLGLHGNARMGVVVQRLINADVAGVMFTRNPATGAAERVIEASWGLGESVVAGLVTPDRYIMGSDGRLTGSAMGEKDISIRPAATGTAELPVPRHLVDAPCLGERDLLALHLLAVACDRAFGATDHDIEFTFASGALFLLQRRPITTLERPLDDGIPTDVGRPGRHTTPQRAADGEIRTGHRTAPS